MTPRDESPRRPRPTLLHLSGSSGMLKRPETFGVPPPHARCHHAIERHIPDASTRTPAGHVVEHEVSGEHIGYVEQL